jgi:hypothetical protein
MLHRITAAKAKTDYTVEITWEDGSASSVSFADLVGHGVCAPLRDRDYFTGRMSIADDGYALAWPGEVEFSADSLWYKTHPADARKDGEAAE